MTQPPSVVVPNVTWLGFLMKSQGPPLSQQDMHLEGSWRRCNPSRKSLTLLFQPGLSSESPIIPDPRSGLIMKLIKLKL